MTPDPACPTCAEQARRIRDLERKLATTELELQNATARGDRYRDRYRALVGKMTVGSIEPVMFVDAPAGAEVVHGIVLTGDDRPVPDWPEPVDQCGTCLGTERHEPDCIMRAWTKLKGASK